METIILKKLWLYSGLGGVLILISGVVWAMRRAHLGLIDPRPISYLGLYSNTKLIFSVSLIVSALLFIIFGLYVARIYRVRRLFLACYIIGQICQIIVAVIPDRSGSSLKIVHTVAGFTLAVSLPFLMRELVYQKHRRSFDRRLFVILYRLEQIMFVIGIGLFVSVKGIAPLGEALPTIGFDSWVLCTTFIIDKVIKRDSRL
jgi:hypothetical membrane protein